MLDAALPHRAGSSSLTAELQSVKKAHVDELYQEAMAIREGNPKKALKLFEKARITPPRRAPYPRYSRGTTV